MQPDRPTLDRRTLIGAGAATLLAPPCADAAVARKSAEARFSAIEKRTGGRLGVAALDTGTNRWLAHRTEERFPMCSTFKWLAVAAVLAKVDHGTDRLDRRIPYGKAELLHVSPITTARLAEGAMPLGDLCAAAITVSDNTAANLILASLGGPAGLTAWLRASGDSVTRLDHVEPALNNPPPGDPRDTTTPSAMIADLRTILLGRTLSEASRARLTGWMIAAKTGARKLRAGLPAGWRVGDKTGAWNGISSNDVAIVWPPSRAPVLIAAYFTGGKATDAERDAALADAARTVVSALELGR